MRNKKGRFQKKKESQKEEESDTTETTMNPGPFSQEYKESEQKELERIARISINRNNQLVTGKQLEDYKWRKGQDPYYHNDFEDPYVRVEMSLICILSLYLNNDFFFSRPLQNSTSQCSSHLAQKRNCLPR